MKGDIVIVNGEAGIYNDGETLLADGTTTSNPPDYFIRVVDEMPAPVTFENVEFPTLETGSRGMFVEIMQVALKYHGFKITCDGVFGAETHKALYNFRYDNYLSGDTICDNDTWKLLLNN